MNSRITKSVFLKRKEENVPITVITAYDYAMAKIIDRCGMDAILIGDSLGNVVLGYDSTLPVTMEDMIHHTKAVCRAAKRAMIITDLPFMSYETSIADGVRNAGRLLKEGGAQAVKIEGGEEIVPVVKAIVSAGIPVMGHLGLTPQSVHQLGGFKVQGKDEQTAQKLINDAKMLEEAGMFSIVLECVPSKLADKVSKSLKIPTIGIGAGNGCDGQVIVINDILGMDADFTPKLAKKYVDLNKIISEAVTSYMTEVVARTFPGEENSFKMSDDVLEKLY
ncbi:3-methyl-2-oxobutanoate hydroxymethyltransferase [Selenomonadales bacterium OttesenSCG-928-I06]|nr:3-methyl-2-oxobutanoate hydroxymethyltransferase [Selenomonadales bacterium OttesenSCG-928-I06]